MRLQRPLPILIALAIHLTTTNVQAEPTLIGIKSCATSTCHGGAMDRGQPWHSSQSIWQSQDPHAWAGFLLVNETSQAMVAALDRDAPRVIASGNTVRAGFELANPDTDAYRRLLSEKCVSCHVTTTASELFGKTIDQEFLARGVSCESCHGPASDWLKRHVDESWQAPALGMRNTRDGIAKIEGCVRCHVGSRTEDGLVRDMNHDLIAAGHPALRFDPSLFTANMPVHWKDRLSNLDAVARSESGRWQTLAAVAKLADERLTDHLRQPDSTPWPELAHYDCFACHHDLRLDDDRRRVGNLGSPDWQPWYLVGQDVAAGTHSKLSLRWAIRTSHSTQSDILRQVHEDAKRNANSRFRSK